MKIDFKIGSNLIVSSLITGIHDVNRNETLANDDFSLVSDWAKSITALGLQGIIFHTNFSEYTCKLHQSDHIHFIKINYNPIYNPNVFRYFVYDEFFKLHAPHMEHIFFTDVSDVLVLKNPFIQELYKRNPNTFFCGDEPEILKNEWMQNHSQHLRSKIPDYTTYETDFKNAALLNCGIMGGSISVMQPFMEELCKIHRTYNSDNTTAYTGDMGAFNYLVRTRYNTKVMHGSPVNTEFKAYEVNDACWFKHK
ncbi:hypothetical protein [uncultured Cytophaga sp.]|uniref:hypothetical protein n=1 Tax=uncultured Cytophaga sp. TaxID=160238 RepID=UPI0026393DBB|nr:hypothetical protein [uncultured Cytophaga sp.]